MQTPMVEITMKTECGAMKLYMGDTLHFLINVENITAICSWIKDGNYFIEYSLREGNPIRTEYSFDNWKTVLDLLEKLSTQNK